MLAYQCPSNPLKISLPEKETTVNLKSASFIIIMLLHEGLTHIQSQINHLLLFGESFTLRLGYFLEGIMPCSAYIFIWGKFFVI